MTAQVTAEIESIRIIRIRRHWTNITQPSPLPWERGDHNVYVLQLIVLDRNRLTVEINNFANIFTLYRTIAVYTATDGIDL